MNNAIDLRQFRYFLAVSEELNVGRAAARLHISQPPLSRQIQQLEDQMGVALFVRTQAGMALTKAGMAFVPEVRRTLAQAAKAVATAKAASDVQADRFVVGYTTVFDRSAIPDVLDRLQAHFPGARISTKGKHSINLVRDVKNGAMEVAFIGLHTQAPGLEVQPLLQQPLMAALPSVHPLARKRRIGFDDLRDATLFRFERRLNPGFYDHCQAFFERIDFKPRTIPEPNDHHILLGLISEGRGIALIPSSLQHVKRRGVAFRPLENRADGLSSGIAVAYRPGNPSHVLARFLELVGLPPP
ncbi:LysR family transcriptional regulator [Variovorax ginsengisoli]|uniref:DNA-binding transcriptional LysR family regulator n=1 Tax=Variovorax ginsengisoli TaxID=363844 RepID=A0ABT9S906_9BURK|nr:LysR family transcriptional regulator [Variovorax ginsengisoli]MDP9900839.1 DNA-binding transcriptional LysR family regulator [Variovorax ginsengisoli]